MKLTVGDSVRITNWYSIGPVTGTVTRVGQFMIRVVFPIRMFLWVPVECCEKVGRSS
jgi:hypothetical protein